MQMQMNRTDRLLQHSLRLKFYSPSQASCDGDPLLTGNTQNAEIVSLGRRILNDLTR